MFHLRGLMLVAMLLVACGSNVSNGSPPTLQGQKVTTPRPLIGSWSGDCLFHSGKVRFQTLNFHAREDTVDVDGDSRAVSVPDQSQVEIAGPQRNVFNYTVVSEVLVLVDPYSPTEICTLIKQAA